MARQPCKQEGCARYGGWATGYCVDHYRSAKVCVEPGCGGRISVTNRYGYCRDHYKVGDTLARMAWLERVDENRD